LEIIKMKYKKIIAIKIITTGILRDKITTYLHMCFLYVRKRKC